MTKTSGKTRTELEFPGYNPIIQNVLWTKRAEKVMHPESKLMVPANRILYIVKHREPTEEEVIDLIQATAAKFRQVF